MTPGHRFPIGMRYMTGGKHPQLCTVVDQLTTRNAAGDIVRERYVSTHEFLGQMVRDSEVCDTTIARGMAAAIVHAGFSVSGPADHRAAEDGEPLWVCVARGLLAEMGRDDR